MVTIKDIARESGYSVSTVSRAISDHPDVSKAAKEKINQVVHKYSFVPNNNAKQLKQASTNTITIVVKGKSNMLFAHMVELMQAQIEREHYTVIVDYIDEDADEVQKAVQLCRETKPLGLLFLGGSMENFQKSYNQIPVPSVLITNSAEILGFHNLSSVFTDDAAGASCAIDYLLEHGHTNIGIIGGSLEKSHTSSLRYQGCMNSLTKAGIAFHHELQYQKARFSFSSAYRAMHRMLEQSSEVTAVFCMSDVMAIGAIRALRDRGISVPDDISIVGYDGIELAEFYNPKIVTIRQIKEKFSLRGVDILIDCIENDAEAIHEVIPFELLHGESVRHITK